MIPGSSNPLMMAAAPAGALQIERSLRFNSSDSAYLSKVFAVAGNRKTWTWSAWVKRASLATGDHQFLFSAGTTNRFALFISSANNIEIHGNGSILRVTTPVYRDSSAWFHLTCVLNTPDGTTQNRTRLYINGVEVTTWSTNVSITQNDDFDINNTITHEIGRNPDGSNRFFNGYLTNIHFIDGQALDPSSFTETDATTGQLIPKTYTGSYGTNGFNLLFADNSSNTASTLGKDVSGLSNNWTPNNLSVTAGAGNDSLVDSPVNGSQTDTGVGGQVGGNYCVMNPLKKGDTYLTLSNGNLDGAWSSGGGAKCVLGTIGMTTGKWYWEMVWNSGTDAMLGIGTDAINLNDHCGKTNGLAYFRDGRKATNNVFSSYGSSWTTGDVIGVAFNADNGELTFYKNNTSQGVAFTVTTGTTYFPAFGIDGMNSWTTNFGQRAFAYTAPSGFKALNTANLPATLVTKSNTVMDVALYTGNGGTQSITGLAFSPDLLWIKARSAGYSHLLADSVRGPLYTLQSDSTSAEQSYGCINSFDSAGFTVDLDGTIGANNNGTTFVAWTWDAGTSTVSNTQGSITSQVRANPTAGFSVVTYTGNNQNSQSIGHGLGVAPKLYIIKCRGAAGTNWPVMTTAIDGSLDYLYLNLTNAKGDAGETPPTSSLIYIGGVGNSDQNNNGNSHVCYAFAPVVGYSNFGSYTGNGSADGPFVYTGFRPRFIMIKNTSATGYWIMKDTARDPANTMAYHLAANSSDADYYDLSLLALDSLSNGFKVRNNNSGHNTNGNVYVYAAFAESPFNYSRAR